MATLTRRELQAQERRNQLIDTALELFAERGLDNTTIKDLSVKAGVAQGLIYHYFDSKEDLLRAVVERHNVLPQLADVFATAAGRPARDVLAAAMNRALELLAGNQAMVRVLFREMLTRPEMQSQVHAMQQVGIRLVTGFLQGRIAAGELRPHDTQATARMLAGFVFAVYATGAPAEPLVTHMLDNLLGGIAAARQS